jgi:hypothetical protein
LALFTVEVNLPIVNLERKVTLKCGVREGRSGGRTGRVQGDMIKPRGCW